jgi:hypothetical protein
MLRRRRHGSGRRSLQVALHPRHNALDAKKGWCGLALSLSALKGRPKAIASDVGVGLAVQPPVRCHPRGLPPVLVQVLRPGGSLIVVDQGQVVAHGDMTAIALPRLIPLGVGTSVAGRGWPIERRRQSRHTLDGSGRFLWGWSRLRRVRLRPMLVDGWGMLCRLHKRCCERRWFDVGPRPTFMEGLIQVPFHSRCSNPTMLRRLPVIHGSIMK